jgi:hypothetical protein
MMSLEKRPFSDAALPLRGKPQTGLTEDDPPSSSYPSRRRPLAPGVYTPPEEPLADSVRRAAEESHDRSVATALPSGSR